MVFELLNGVGGEIGIFPEYGYSPVYSSSGSLNNAIWEDFVFILPF